LGELVYVLGFSTSILGVFIIVFNSISNFSILFYLDYKFKSGLLESLTASNLGVTILVTNLGETESRADLCNIDRSVSYPIIVLDVEIS